MRVKVEKAVEGVLMGMKGEMPDPGNRTGQLASADTSREMEPCLGRGTASTSPSLGVIVEAPAGFLRRDVGPVLARHGSQGKKTPLPPKLSSGRLVEVMSAYLAIYLGTEERITRTSRSIQVVAVAFLDM